MKDAMIDGNELAKALNTIPGGYTYMGVCSVQTCFPLKNGGELRFMYVDDDVDDDPADDTKTINVRGRLKIDFYGGELPPGITGPVSPTGPKKSSGPQT